MSVLVRRLLMTTGGTGGFTGTRSMPSSWGVTRLGGNPIITVTPGNPAESHEQYTPGPIVLPNGDRWVYVKGQSRIYAWKAVSGSATYTLQNGGSPVLAPIAATWEGSFVLEPAMVYDAATGIIHMFYKGRDANPVNWQWGHATASDSDPTTFTRDGANPILTKANAQTQLGGGSTTDLAISDVFVIDGIYHFFGYGQYNSGGGDIYRLLHATGTTWNDPSGLTSILSAASTSAVVERPSVIAVPGIGPALYAIFYSRGTTSTRSTSIWVGSSTDLSTFDFTSTADVMAPTSGWEADQVFAAGMLKSSAEPYLDPVVDSLGRWSFYYSGIGGGAGNANVGLAYMVPVF